jgi:hypothetical protein
MKIDPLEAILATAGALAFAVTFSSCSLPRYINPTNQEAKPQMTRPQEETATYWKGESHREPGIFIQLNGESLDPVIRRIEPGIYGNQPIPSIEQRQGILKSIRTQAEKQMNPDRTYPSVIFVSLAGVQGYK